MRIFYFLFLIGVLFFSTSCYANAEKIAISTDFSIEQQNIIVYAADRWFESCPELELEIFLSEDNPTIVPRTCTENGAWGNTELRSFKHPVSYLCTRESQDEFKVIAMHELGHYLTGKPSHTTGESVMKEDIDKSDIQSLNLTDQDIDWACK